MKTAFTCILMALLGLGLAEFDFNTPNCESGRTVIVHLFNWKWTDIAAECERFLGPKKYCGVQVSPPNEHIVWTKDGFNRPWWERYQPVSYKLESRSGNKQQFTNMVQRCKAVGVNIYVDTVINHMVYSDLEGYGTGGSYYNSNSDRMEFAGVPWNATDFNCCKTGYVCSTGAQQCQTQSCNIESYQDAVQIRNCRLGYLVDLAVAKDDVRDVLAGYLNKLIDIGVAGFRVDACKHMWPVDLEAIYDRLNDKSIFVYNEVIDLGGEPVTGDQYTHLGRVTEFKYGRDLGNVFRGWENPWGDEQKLAYLKNFGWGWGMLKDEDAFVFVDNHDNQRGHGAGGASILSHKVSKLYKKAVAFGLAWPYGFTRIMSSYAFGEDTDAGPPSQDGTNIDDVTINADGTCGGGWICEHRWRQIYNMVGFRNQVADANVSMWWDNGENQIAFQIGTKGFVAFNNENKDFSQSFTVGLPAGTYCDIISGNLENGSCTGDKVVVGSDGKLAVFLANDQGDDSKDGILAIHTGMKLE